MEDIAPTRIGFVDRRTVDSRSGSKVLITTP